MAMLVFDLHKEPHGSISQPCCYSFSNGLTGENRKQGERKAVRWTRTSFLLHQKVPPPPTPSLVSLALSVSPHMLFCQLSNCSTYANLRG